MRLVLAQLAPRAADLAANLDRLRSVVAGSPGDLVIFPELYLSGYRIGDRVHRLALREGDATLAALRAIARESRATVVVGAPFASRERPGEVQNTAVAIRPDGEVHVQVKRYLPTFGPFDEGSHFTPAVESAAMPLAAHAVGLQICYDAFFPEVSRALALDGAELLVVISASPVTSGRFFARLLPARAIENATPVVFVNRVGVEDGVVFGGGSGAWDARGEPLPTTVESRSDLASEERVLRTEIDLRDAARWRPFRPVLRDVAARTTGPAALPV
jgi:predicted amidohydrolase